jgi:hypothetical protein
MRGSEQLTHEIRDAAVTYERVASLLIRDWYLLECGHTVQESERNPAHVGQARYCRECTEAKLRKTNEI